MSKEGGLGIYCKAMQQMCNFKECIVEYCPPRDDDSRRFKMNIWDADLNKNFQKNQTPPNNSNLPPQNTLE